jgi:antitoxin HigA-1
MVKVRIRTHPGEMLQHEFLEPLGMSAAALARELGIPANRLTEIIAGRRGITADTAIRLARYWGTSVEFWTNMQAGHDISVAQSRVFSC